MPSAQGLRSPPKDQPAMQKFEPEAASRVRATHACISAWARRQELRRLSYDGPAGRSTNWDRSRRIRNWSSEREAGSSEEITDVTNLRNLVVRRISIFCYS